ncbi:hypothetical protein [Actinomadura sp. 6N118]|uniref:hypothetical protein n=1 Tax=Actinomadura sp. 6N118 TaxID=3375151 RepID=UPI0037BA13E3
MSTPFPPGFSGIDPTLMDGLINEFRRGHADIAGAMGPYRPRLARYGIDTAALREIDQVCAWVDEQLPMLTRRRDLAIALDDSSQPGLASVDESLILSPSRARQMGAELAARFLKSSDYHDILNELGTYRFDADYAAAFFARLGPELTRRLPALIEAHGRDGHVARQLRETGEAFASAVSGGMDVPGFGTVTQAMFDKNLPVADRQGVATLVSYGSFPPEWLVALARLHALEPAYQQFTAGGATARPDLTATDWHTLQRMFQALSNNPVAARLAFQGVAHTFPQPNGRTPGDLTPPHQPDLGHTLATFTRIASLDEATAQQLGRALSAGAGAKDETDGAHSSHSARFAFAVMTALPEVSDRLPDPMRIELARIAGSYATEITEGANLDDRVTDTAFGNVKTHTPGLKPMFSLSPQDTYAYLKLFADSPEHMALLDQGMGRLSHRLVRLGIHIEIAKQQGKIRPDAPGLERIMQALGYVSGLQTQAQKTVQGDLDERDARNREMMRTLADLGFDVADVFVGGLPVSEAGAQAVEAIWYVVTKQSGQTLDAIKDKADQKTRLSMLEDKELQMSLGLQHAMVQRLLQGGYPLKVKPADAKLPHPGHLFWNDEGLIPYDEMTKNPKILDNYLAWLEANGRGGDSDAALGQVGVNASGAFSGKAKDASDTARLWEKSE